METPQSRYTCLKQLEHIGLLTVTAHVSLAGLHALFLGDCKAQDNPVPEHTSGSCSDRSLCCSTTSPHHSLLPEAEPTNRMQQYGCVGVINP